MITRKNLLLIILPLVMSSTTYAQNRPQLADTTKDETGMLRYFKMSKKEPPKSLLEAEKVLQDVFTPKKEMAFKLVKTKAGSNNKKSLLYQQTYNFFRGPL